METIEFTTPEKYEALPELVAELRTEMQAKIVYALSLGVFTGEEAELWQDSFEQCTEIEHMENLVEIIDRFIDSGWEVVSEIEELLATGEINDQDRRQFLAKMDMLSYQEKLDLLRELEWVLNEVSRKKARLTLILSQNKVARPKAVVLEQEFDKAALAEKDTVLERAAVVAKKGRPAPEGKTNDLVRLLDSYIQSGTVALARQMLEKNFPDNLTYLDYVRFDARINQLEVQQKQCDVRATYQ
ncbi:MAG: hypothetical protein PHR51_02275 [Patescibacteria group bacterium]|nr:hypothetical protein [Patescibacteria group bacterium]